MNSLQSLVVESVVVPIVNKWSSLSACLVSAMGFQWVCFSWGELLPLFPPHVFSAAKWRTERAFCIGSQVQSAVHPVDWHWTGELFLRLGSDLLLRVSVVSQRLKVALPNSVGGPTPTLQVIYAEKGFLLLAVTTFYFVMAIFRSCCYHCNAFLALLHYSLLSYSSKAKRSPKCLKNCLKIIFKGISHAVLTKVDT